VLDERGVRVRDLPNLAGVSKPAVAMSLGFLEKNGYVTFEADATAPRTRQARPTAKGLDAQAAHARRLAEVEAHWQKRFADDLNALRASCMLLVRDSHLERSPLAQALETYRTGWRSSVPQPTVLPRHPMVLHRGGWPDGS
jgi:DNA-binding MarR family transcriptional regulator